MSRFIKLLLIVLSCSALSGCMEITDVYTLNPDGSGKVVHEAVLAQMNLSMDGSSSGPTEESLRKAVQDELKKAKGVEAWSDVSFEQRGKDQFYFKGTAYFKDINKLKFHNSGAKVNVYDQIVYTKDGAQAQLEVISSEDEDKEEEVVDVTEETVDEEIASLQAEYQKSRMMAAGIFSGIKYDRRFYLPGSVDSSSNFPKNDDGAYVNKFEGIKLLEFMDQIMNDTALLRKELLSGSNPLAKGGLADVNKMNEFIFGEEGPIVIAYTPGTQPLMDYAAEVAQADEKFEAMAEEVGMPKKVVLKGPEGSHFKVGGARIIHDSDSDNDLRPFNYDEGYTLSIVGRLPQPAMSVTEGQLISAQTDHGQDLLPSDEWKQKISFPRLSKDKRKVIFEVELRRPAQSAKGIAELSGNLTYVVAEKARRVDLNMTTFTEGTKGVEFDAEIKSLKDSEWNPGKQELQLYFKLSKDAVKAVEIFDASGNQLDVSQGYMASGNTVTYRYTLTKGGDFPTTGRIVVEVYEDLQTYELPFKLKDISLLGRKSN